VIPPPRAESRGNPDPGVFSEHGVVGARFEGKHLPIVHAIGHGTGRESLGGTEGPGEVANMEAMPEVAHERDDRLEAGRAA
jgi:hypothetical protein